MKRKKYGYTLIELIITLGITVTVLGIASSMFITGNKVFSDSDVKSTLQIEGQTIQEKISDIGMQAVGIKTVSGDNHSNELESITISSYDKNGNHKDYHLEIEDTGNNYKDNSNIYRLMIDDEEISGNIKSFKIDSDIITADANALKNTNSIECKIILREEKGYSNIEQPVSFRATFRNK